MTRQLRVTVFFFSLLAGSASRGRGENGDFFYGCPQRTYSPSDWFHVGLVAQRTKAYHTSLDAQRGLLVGFSHRKLEDPGAQRSAPPTLGATQNNHSCPRAVANWRRACVQIKELSLLIVAHAHPIIREKC